jgi:transcriptional regulator with XRE-family HTH domain
MVNILSVDDVQVSLAKRLRRVRLDANLTQHGLAERAGVSLGSLKRFEREGEISLKSLVKLAFALRWEDDFEKLFQPREKASLDTLLEQTLPKTRQRGRKS